MAVRIHEISLTPCISKQLFATKSGGFFFCFIHSAYPIATKSIYVHADIHVLMSPSSNLYHMIGYCVVNMSHDQVGTRRHEYINIHRLN